jgi:hypothetical protein
MLNNINNNDNNKSKKNKNNNNKIFLKDTCIDPINDDLEYFQGYSN